MAARPEVLGGSPATGSAVWCKDPVISLSIGSYPRSQLANFVAVRTAMATACELTINVTLPISAKAGGRDRHELTWWRWKTGAPVQSGFVALQRGISTETGISFAMVHYCDSSRPPSSALSCATGMGGLERMSSSRGSSEQLQVCYLHMWERFTEAGFVPHFCALLDGYLWHVRGCGGDDDAQIQDVMLLFFRCCAATMEVARSSDVAGLEILTGVFEASFVNHQGIKSFYASLTVMIMVLDFMQCFAITASILALLSNNGSTTIFVDVIWLLEFDALGASLVIYHMASMLVGEVEHNVYCLCCIWIKNGFEDALDEDVRAFPFGCSADGG